MLLSVHKVLIDHRRYQNVTHWAVCLESLFFFLPHFDVICDLLLNRHTADVCLTWCYCNLQLQNHHPFLCLLPLSHPHLSIC